MRKFHSIAALCGDGLRPELQALFDRLAVDPHSELFVRQDGMVQSGPDPVSETIKIALPVPKRVAWSEMANGLFPSAPRIAARADNPPSPVLPFEQTAPTTSVSLPAFTHVS
jgi:hypothetical protein